jgi:hypothetical protein
MQIKHEMLNFTFLTFPEVNKFTEVIYTHARVTFKVSVH